MSIELKVWVEGIQRIVCGVTDKTTCQDVVYALAHATGKTGRFTLIEKWRNNERLLAPAEHPLRVLRKWGKYHHDVQFILQRTELNNSVPGVVNNHNQHVRHKSISSSNVYGSNNCHKSSYNEPAQLQKQPNKLESQSCVPCINRKSNVGVVRKDNVTNNHETHRNERNQTDFNNNLSNPKVCDPNSYGTFHCDPNAFKKSVSAQSVPALVWKLPPSSTNVPFVPSNNGLPMRISGVRTPDNFLHTNSHQTQHVPPKDKFTNSDSSTSSEYSSSHSNICPIGNVENHVPFNNNKPFHPDVLNHANVKDRIGSRANFQRGHQVASRSVSAFEPERSNHFRQTSRLSAETEKTNDTRKITTDNERVLGHPPIPPAYREPPPVKRTVIPPPQCYSPPPAQKNPVQLTRHLSKTSLHTNSSSPSNISKQFHRGGGTVNNNSKSIVNDGGQNISSRGGSTGLGRKLSVSTYDVQGNKMVRVDDIRQNSRADMHQQQQHQSQGSYASRSDINHQKHGSEFQTSSNSRSSLQNHEENCYSQSQQQTVTDLIRLVSSQQWTLSNQEHDMRKHDMESLNYERKLNNNNNQGNGNEFQSSANPTNVKKSADRNPSGSSTVPAIHVVSEELRRLEQLAAANDSELVELDSTIESVASSNSSIRNNTSSLNVESEINELKHRLYGTDVELRKTNSTLQRLDSEMKHIIVRDQSSVSESQPSPSIHQEMECLLSEIEKCDKSAVDSAKLSQQLSDEIRALDAKMAGGRAQVEQLVAEMKKSAVESEKEKSDSSADLKSVEKLVNDNQRVVSPPSTVKMSNKNNSVIQDVSSSHLPPTFKHPNGVWV